jgi:hypothetical protein
MLPASAGATAAKVQGVLFPKKISGVDTVFGLLVHVLPGKKKQRGLEPSILLS